MASSYPQHARPLAAAGELAELKAALCAFDGLHLIDCRMQSGGIVVLLQYGSWKDSSDLVFTRLLPALGADVGRKVACEIEAAGNMGAVTRLSIDPAVLRRFVRVLRQAALLDGTAAGATDAAVAIPAGDWPLQAAVAGR